MKSILTTAFAALLIGASPAWADPWKDESGHGRQGKHWEKEWKKEHKHWAKHEKHAEKEWRKAQKHWAKHHRPDFDDRVVVHQHIHPAPVRVVEREVIVHRSARVVEHHHHVVVPASPPPGIHVVIPSLYVPF